MSRHVALLRGINLGSRNRVAMPALRALFEKLGFRDVESYVQSGNVVFDAAGRRASGLAREIESAIAKTLELEVTVVVRSAAQLARLVEGNPYPEADPAQLHVTLLADRPAADRVRVLAAGSYDPDEARVKGRDVYIRCPNGYGRSRLSNAFLERTLAVAGTTRNWRSVTALSGLAGQARDDAGV